MLDPATGTPWWSVPRVLFSDAGVVADLLVIGQDEDGPGDSATAYDLRTGAKRWRATVPSSTRRVPSPNS